VPQMSNGSGEQGRQRVGFIGLGTMGLPMALNVARSGHQLTVFDLAEAPVKEAVALGATAARTVEEVGAASDVILVAVVDDAQVEGVLLGTEGPGVFGTAEPGSVVVVHSTINPRTCRRLEALAEERGLHLLDGPISGGPMGAREGTLSIMVGGDPAALEACRPVLETMSQRVFHLGDIGMGEVAKVANNVVLAICLEATHEGLALARDAGIDEDVMLDVLGTSTGDSWAVRNWHAVGEVARNYPNGPRGVANLTYKDISLALSIGHDQGTPLPVVGLTSQLLEEPYRRVVADPG
jgi:3-hydroxyisobutyrate dehydrogenase-like beta-hydroxyacid dehydrogenase